MRWNIRDKLLAAFSLVIVCLSLPVALFFATGHSVVQQYKLMHETIFIEAQIRQECDEIASLIPSLIAKDSNASIRKIEARKNEIGLLLAALDAAALHPSEEQNYRLFSLSVNGYLNSCDKLIKARQANDLKEVTEQMEQALFKSTIINREASNLIANEISILSANQSRFIAQYWRTLCGATLLLLLLVAFTIFFVSNFSSRIRHDLSQIIQAAEQVASGRTQQISLTPRSRDEIGDLALKFNWMAKRLNEVLKERDASDEKLRNAYADMENQVSLRTQELFALNQELIATNEQLQDTVATLNMTQANLVQAEKLAALGTLVSGVAHELNTPVGNCITLASHLKDSNAALLLDYEKNTLTRSRLANHLTDSREACLSLTLNLQTTSRLIHSFKQIYIDRLAEDRLSFALCRKLKEVNDQIMPQLRHAGISLHCDCQQGIMLDSYPEALGNVLLSLLQNSLLHAFDTKQNAEICISATTDAHHLKLIYRDNGKGLTPSELNHIFEPFFTTKRGRGCVGLGLHTVFNIVTQLLGGKIRASSQPQHGLEFTIDLPLELKMTGEEEAT